MIAAEPKVRVALMPGAQSDFERSGARHPAMISGRGGGKTIAGVAKGFRKALQHEGALGVLTEPTYPQVRDVLLPAIRKLYGPVEGEVWHFRRQDMEIRFYNGSRMLLRAAEALETLRGLTLAFFGMDEARKGQQEEAFYILQGCLRQEGYPHQGWVTTTPAGIRHWLYRVFVVHQARDGRPLPAGDYPVFRARTAENFHLPPQFYESLRASYTGRFAEQELEGEFVVFEGQGFPQFDEAVHVREIETGLRPTRVIHGLDFGVVSPTAVVEVWKRPDGRLHARREFYRRRCDERELVERMGDWSPTKLVCDPTAKGAIDMLRRHGLPATKARSNDFGLRARLVGARLNVGPDGLPGMFISPQCPNLIEELRTLAYARYRGQDILNDRWEPGLDDHAYDGLAYVAEEFDAGLPMGPPPRVKIVYSGWNYE